MDGILSRNLKKTTDFDEYELYRRLKSWYMEDIEHVNEWREQAREDFDFYNGRQWAEEDLAVLKAQRRPVMTFNRIAPLVNAIVGAERNNKREVQFQPRQVGAAISNELLTGAAEWFRDEAEAEYADSDSFQDMVICGMGWTDTRLDYETDPEGTPAVQRLDPLKMVWDANAVRPNLIDAQRLWYVDRKTIEDAKSLFPDVAVEDLHADWAIDSTTACEEYHVSLDAYHEDSNTDSSSESLSGKRYVTLVECRWFEYEAYFKAPDLQTGQMRNYSKQEFEQLQRVVPQLQGVYFSKKVVRRAFLGRRLLAKADKPLAPDGQLGWECITGTLDKLKNQFYGIVRPAKDPQKWSNKYFSQVMYILNSQAKGGLMAERGAFDDERQALENWARTDTITWVKNGALTGGKIQPKPSAQFPSGFFQLFNESREAITHVTGLSAEFIGTREINQANVLENTRRQSTLNLLAGLFDNLKLYRCRQGKIILYLIQNYLSDGRLVRISGPENAQYVPLTREAVTTLEYDIIVDDSPTSPNEKEKTFAALTQMLPLLGGFLTPEMISDLLKLSPLPATLVANLTAKAQQAQQEQQQQQMMQQSQGTQLTPEQQAKIAALQQECQAKETLYQLDAQQKQAALQQKNIELFLKQEQARMQLELQRAKNEIEQRDLERKAYRAQLEQYRATKPKEREFIKGAKETMEEKFTPEEQAIYDEHFASDHPVELVEPEQVEEVFEAEESFEKPLAEPSQQQLGDDKLEQERQARQKAEKNAIEARELAIEFAQKYAAIQEEAARQRDENVPKLEDDPKAHVAWLSHKVQEQQKLLDEFSRIKESQERVRQEEYERQQLGDYFEQAKAQVQDKYPDLDNITDYLYKIADNTLQAQAGLYPQWNDPMARQQQIGVELRQICQQCQKAGINPIEVLVQKAKAFGYSGAPMKDEVGGRDEVGALQERSQAARTLTARGGQVPTGGMDVRTLFSMPEAEFAVWVEKNPEKFEQIMSRA